MQSTVNAFSYDPASGALHLLQTLSTLPKDFEGESTSAEVEVHPSGKFLYGSNRGGDSIAVFAIDRGKGTLTPVTCVPTLGKTRAALRSTHWRLPVRGQPGLDSIVLFRIDPKSGILTPTGQMLEVPMPVFGG